MLEGKSVNLRVAEKEDLPLLGLWRNSPEFQGEHNPLMQEPIGSLAKRYDNLPPGEEWFLIEKKDGARIGLMVMVPEGGAKEIGFGLLPGERGKGYCTEAVKIAVDYLFLAKPLVRILANTEAGNIASQRVLEKAGFKREGIARKATFARGGWRDEAVYSILREEWGGPKILTKQTANDKRY